MIEQTPFVLGLRLSGWAERDRAVLQDAVSTSTESQQTNIPSVEIYSLTRSGAARPIRKFLSLDKSQNHISIMSYCPEPFSGEDSICQALHHALESRKTRAKLTEADALDIFHCKAHSMSAASVSKKYGVSEKAVRDIWTGRTWSKETWHLDTSRSRPLKKMGRPVGRKDAKPRKPRVVPKKLELRDAAAAISHLDRHRDKSVDEQLHEWYLRSKVACDFKDPFECDLAVHDRLMLQLMQHESEHCCWESSCLDFQISNQERQCM